MDRIDTLHTREATLRQSVEIMQAVAEAAEYWPAAQIPVAALRPAVAQ